MSLWWRLRAWWLARACRLGRDAALDLLDAEAAGFRVGRRQPVLGRHGGTRKLESTTRR